MLATVVRLTRDVDAAQDAVQEAFAAALDAWRAGGVPANPGAWLTATARRKAVDARRREESVARRLPLLIVPEPTTGYGFPDDRLRLIFTCCHPALDVAARVALTLNVVCGLPTADIAHLFLVPEPTMAARVTRAKRKLRAAGIPYRVPAPRRARRTAAGRLVVVYLLFSQGHTPGRGTALTAADVAARAIDLARLLVRLLPDEPEATGLLALLLLTDARRPARLDAAGAPVLLADQDRTLWDRALIAEGTALVDGAAARAVRRTGRDRRRPRGRAPRRRHRLAHDPPAVRRPAAGPPVAGGRTSALYGVRRGGRARRRASTRSSRGGRRAPGRLPPAPGRPRRPAAPVRAVRRGVPGLRGGGRAGRQRGGAGVPAFPIRWHGDRGRGKSGDMTDREPLEETPEAAAAVDDETTVSELVTGGGPSPDDEDVEFQAPGEDAAGSDGRAFIIGESDGPDDGVVARTGAEQPWDPEDLAEAEGRDPTPEPTSRGPPASWRRTGRRRSNGPCPRLRSVTDRRVVVLALGGTISSSTAAAGGAVTPS